MRYKGIELQVGDKLKTKEGGLIKVEAILENIAICLLNERYAVMLSIVEMEASRYELVEREPWKPKENEGYYFVGDDGYVHLDRNSERTCDIWRYKTGNCFRTREEAEAYKKSILEK